MNEAKDEVRERPLEEITSNQNEEKEEVRDLWKR